MQKFPPYPARAHSSGQAKIKVDGAPVYLGKFGSPESMVRYEEERTRWRATLAGGLPGVGKLGTVGDVVEAWLGEAERRYAADKRELSHHAYACAVVNALHRSTAAADFGPRALRQVQAEMVRRGWCGRVVNRQLVRVRTMFRWAESEELIPGGAFHRLQTVAGLTTQRQDVPPVPEADLAATIPELVGPVRAAVTVQLHSGARPAEVLGLRPVDILREGRVELAPGLSVDLGGCWAAVLEKHKTQRYGHRRVLLFGPKAREALAPLLDREADAFLFNPREAPRNNPRRATARYSVDCYRQSIGYACRQAIPPGWHAPLVLNRGVPAWSPYRLRHNAASRLVAQFGWDVARIILGHRTVSTTRLYATDDLAKAVAAIARAG